MENEEIIQKLHDIFADINQLNVELDKIKEAKELNIYLQNAIQDAEKRALIECGED